VLFFFFSRETTKPTNPTVAVATGSGSGSDSGGVGDSGSGSGSSSGSGGGSGGGSDPPLVRMTVRMWDQSPIINQATATDTGSGSGTNSGSGSVNSGSVNSVNSVANSGSGSVNSVTNPGSGSPGSGSLAKSGSGSVKIGSPRVKTVEIGVFEPKNGSDSWNLGPLEGEMAENDFFDRAIGIELATELFGDGFLYVN
jgi:hypothetical protein